MAITTPPTLGADPQTINSSVLNGMVNPLVTDYNGNVDDSNIATTANIASSKLNLTAINQSVANSGTTTLSGVTTMSGKRLNEAKCADIASATTTTIWATDGNYAHITGTTTITSFGTAAQAGAVATIVFDGILTLTHNATSLILPSAANITTAVGDRAIVRAETTANARVISYTKADGTSVVANTYTPTAANALSGSVVQVVSTQSGTFASGATQIPNDNTIPQITEGDEYMTRAITPNSATNKLRIDVVFNYDTSAAARAIVALFQDATAGALAASSQFCNGVEGRNQSFTYYMTAGTTSSTTFRVRCGGQGATISFNGYNGAAILGGVMTSSITISEIKV